MGTLIVLFVVAVLAGFAIGKIYRDKKQGRGCCGQSCSSCSGCSHFNDEHNS